MKISERKIKIRELVKKYYENKKDDLNATI